MKLIKSISLLSILIFFSINLYSQDAGPGKKNRLLIYNFTTTDNYDSNKEKEKNYQYYSIVIPETIFKGLNKSANYEIIRDPRPFNIKADYKNDAEKRKYIKKLEETGFKNRPDYIITGTFNVVDKKLSVHVAIFDVKGKDILLVDHESGELGVQFQGTTDLLSQHITENIENFNKLNRIKSERSPFISMYKPFSIMTLGIDGGYLYILKEWHSLYKNTLYVSPFLDFDISESFSLSLKFTSIQSDSGGDDDYSDSNYIQYSQIRILSSSLALCYTYRFNRNFGLALSAGGGLSETTITIEPDKPFVDAKSEEKSTDPNIDISTYFTCTLSTLTIKAGVLYKRIFYEDEPMETGVIFAGAGIHF